MTICLSGGPASGKSTCLAHIERMLTEKYGKKVLIIPETATELIANGIAPSENIPSDEFQSICLDKQLSKEKLYSEVAQTYFIPEETVIICDRGVLDQLAYTSRETLSRLLRNRGMTIGDVVGRYDVVIHLVSSAKGIGYTTENNGARRENAEEAAALDDKTLAGNMTHPNVKVVNNAENFEDKVTEVLQVVRSEIGIPEPTEIERKFLVRRPSNEALSALSHVAKTNISQTYLIPNKEGEERRVRQRGTPEDGYTFYYTEKSLDSGICRIERERRISMREYVDLLAEADSKLHTIRKTRYSFAYKSQHIELDVYPGDDEYAIVEVELTDEGVMVELPDAIEVIKEVTDDDDYRNRHVAERGSLLCGEHEEAGAV